MDAKQEALPSSGFQITATSTYLETMAAITGDDRLSELLSMIQKHADEGDGFFKLMIPEEQQVRAEFLDTLPGLSLEMKAIFSITPISSREAKMEEVWAGWARKASKLQYITLDFIASPPARASLAEAEMVVRLLAAYRWMGYRLPAYFVDYDEAEILLATWTAVVDDHLRSRRKQGVGGGRAGMPSWYWSYKPTGIQGKRKRN